MKRRININLIILLCAVFLTAFLNVDNKKAPVLDEVILSEEMKEHKLGVEPERKNTYGMV